MKELEKVIDRIIYGTDMDWNMNIHHFDWVPGVGPVSYTHLTLPTNREV